ncbi:hypothetical protein [Schaalia vaccimaxillae]|uniref:hypothetical protein n=1 Tax=Schaalia vaccimaxillae TaxID=183916 RepID=UPI0003B6E9C0|nr:hypothetical protein [Schaalia vaccimaxillae]
MNTHSKSLGALASAAIVGLSLTACTPIANETQLTQIENAITALGTPITGAEATHESRGENGIHYRLTISVAGDSINSDKLRSAVIAAADATTFEFTSGIIHVLGGSGEALKIHETAIEAGIPNEYLKLNDMSIDRFNDTELHELADQLR